MTNMNLYDALIEIGVSKENARKTAESIDATEPRFDALDHKIDLVEANLERKIDLLGSDLKGEINRVETGLRGEMTMIKWMFGVLVAGVVAIILKVFSH